MNPDRQLEHMTSELGLTADQQNQIRPLLVDRQQKMQALFQDQSIAQQDRRAQMQSIRQDSQSKIEAVLNDQQKQKFAAMQEHMGRGGREGGPQGGPPEGAAPQPQIVKTGQDRRGRISPLRSCPVTPASTSSQL